MFMVMFQDLAALLVGILILSWWLADWIRSGCVLELRPPSTANILHISLMLICSGHNSVKCVWFRILMDALYNLYIFIYIFNASLGLGS